MADLTLDKVRDIGIAAIRRVIGDTFTDADLGFTFGAEDSASHLFTLRFPSEAAWRRAVPLSSKMGLAIGDELWAKGDARIALTRLESDGTWDLMRHAAAERAIASLAAAPDDERSDLLALMVGGGRS